MTISGYHQVQEFHEVFGHPLNTSLQFNIFTENPKLVDFRISLIDEEIKEFIDACSKKDFIEAIDAIADIMYVVYGAMHVFGVNYDSYTSLSPLLYTTSYNNNDNINVFDTNKSELLKETKKLELYLSMLNKNKNLLNFNDFVKHLDNIICECYTISSLFNIDIDKCFAEVHRSNMSKVCTSEEEALQTVIWYKKNEKRYTDPTYRKSSNSKYWIVFDNTTSKILKSIHFELPKLSIICFNNQIIDNFE